jgi:hypothetical protein
MLTVFRTGEGRPVVFFGVGGRFSADAVGGGVDFRLDLAAPRRVFLCGSPLLLENVVFGNGEAVSTERRSF